MSLKVIIEPAKKYQKATNPNLFITLSGEQVIHRINRQPSGLSTFVFLDGIGRLELDNFSDTNYTDAAPSDSSVVAEVSAWMYANGVNA